MNSTQEHARIIARLDPGDEVLDSLERLRDEFDVENGFLSGIAAVDRATLGHYDVENQTYNEETFTGQFELPRERWSRQDLHPYSTGNRLVRVHRW